MTREYITVNENGMRVGQSHPNAVLSDVEVESLILDRGPDDAPTMSYRELALKWGCSKSTVRDYLTGRRRAQTQKTVPGQASERTRQKKVRTVMYVSLHNRATLRRLGGGKWIDMVCAQIQRELSRAPSIDPEQALARVLRRFGAAI